MSVLGQPLRELRREIAEVNIFRHSEFLRPVPRQTDGAGHVIQVGEQGVGERVDCSRGHGDAAEVQRRLRGGLACALEVLAVLPDDQFREVGRVHGRFRH